MSNTHDKSIYTKKESTTDDSSQVDADVILPCPFCGSQPGPNATEENGQLWCDTCGARGSQRKFEWMKGKDGIIGRWNIRAI